MNDTIEIKVNVFDLIGKYYRVYDNSYIIRLSDGEPADLYLSVLKIVSIPFRGITEDIFGRETWHDFILVRDDINGEVYRVLFGDNGIIL